MTNAAGFGDPALQQSAIGGSNRCLCLSLIACFCGMATKQVMVTAPVLVLLYDRAFVSGSFRSALANRRWYYASLAATWLWLGFLMHQSSLATVSVGFKSGVSWMTYALTELRVVMDYLKLAFWPHPLVFDYGAEIVVTDPLTVLPYALTVRRNHDYRSDLSIWEDTVARHPRTSRGHSNLGMALAKIPSRLLDAIAHYEEALRLKPAFAEAHNNLANALAKIPGRKPDTIVHYEAALRLRPDYAEAHNNLAAELVNIPGRLADAIAHYETAVRLKPDFGRGAQQPRYGLCRNRASRGRDRSIGNRRPAQPGIHRDSRRPGKTKSQATAVKRRFSGRPRESLFFGLRDPGASHRGLAPATRT